MIPQIASGLTGNNRAWSQFGTAIANLGDIDNDGYPGTKCFVFSHLCAQYPKCLYDRIKQILQSELHTKMMGKVLSTFTKGAQRVCKDDPLN
jgi:hypothetical protein